MIVTLKETATGTIVKKLLEAQEDYAMATGRVLTLIVVAEATDPVESILDAVREASHEHPARVLIVLSAPDSEDARLDAELLLGDESGASEIVIMTLHGEMSEHPDAVVTPLLLPDTPIVAWWPLNAPGVPAEHPIGRIAQRRITNVCHRLSNEENSTALEDHRAHHAPGDSDMMWSQITDWRGLVASAMDRRPHSRVTNVDISGPAEDPSVDIAAGWLAHYLEVPVERKTSERDPELFPIHSLVLQRESGPLSLEVADKTTLKVSMPGDADSLVAFSPRSVADCLAEELRYLDVDAAYARALNGLGKVTYR